MPPFPTPFFNIVTNTFPYNFSVFVLFFYPFIYPLPIFLLFSPFLS